ncbi:hypothetical protein B0H11DRAFT_1979956 [Mycena galericulata]|nr:hypothetical protein B0H11DRAFT_1979956 [Mycena galericulata]
MVPVPPPREQGSGASAGVIIGITLGAIVFFSLILSVIFLKLYRSRRTQESGEENSPLFDSRPSGEGAREKPREQFGGLTLLVPPHPSDSRAVIPSLIIWPSTPIMNSSTFADRETSSVYSDTTESHSTQLSPSGGGSTLHLVAEADAAQMTTSSSYGIPTVAGPPTACPLLTATHVRHSLHPTVQRTIRKLPSIPKLPSRMSFISAAGKRPRSMSSPTSPMSAASEGFETVLRAFPPPPPNPPSQLRLPASNFAPAGQRVSPLQIMNQ